MRSNSDKGQQAPVIREYTKLAKDYDRRWSFYINATVSETLSRFTLTPGERILDVGCGTGALLHALDNRDPTLRLTGIDPVAAMLDVARRRLLEKVELQQAWAENLPFPDAGFDKVVSCNMFHYVTGPAQALDEFHRVLAPGGQLIITDWCDNYFSCKVCGLYLRLSGSAYHEVYKEEELQSLLAAAGFMETRVERYKINWLWGLMTAVAQRH